MPARLPRMASFRLVSGLVAGAVIAAAAGVAAAPRVWRRVRGGGDDMDAWADDAWPDEEYLTDFDEPTAEEPPPTTTIVEPQPTFGSDEPTDEGGEAEILREELRERLSDLPPTAAPSADPVTEAAPGDGDTEAARARLRARAAEAREAFRKPVE